MELKSIESSPMFTVNNENLEKLTNWKNILMAYISFFKI